MLGVQRDASQQQIQAAYRQLTRRYHPDVNQGDAEIMAKVNVAYRTLSNADSRARYDRYGPERSRRTQPKGRPSDSPGPAAS